MSDARRRHIAWLFALVLLMELAVLCCASMHLSDHCCCGHACAICACVRAGLRRAALAALALAALTAVAVVRAGAPASGRFTHVDSLFDRRVRLND